MRFALKILFSTLAFGLLASNSMADEFKRAPTELFAPGKAIKGQIELGPKLQAQFKGFTGEDAIYIIARNAGDDSGPIKGVIKIEDLAGKKFPIAFEMGPRNVMIAEPESFTGPYILKAKLSRSGGATSQEGDLIGYFAPKEGVKVGDKPITITLDEVFSGGAPSAAAGSGSAPMMEQKAPMLSPEQMAAGSTAEPILTPSDQDPISGSISMSPELEKSLGKFAFNEKDVIFVIIKDAKSPRPQPVAVARIDNLKDKKFPIHFEIGPQNVMAGGAYKGPFHIKVKLSRQGGAATNEGDLVGDYDPKNEVKPGDQGVKLQLSTKA